MDTFSSRIKELRTSLKMTQSEFASSIGSSQNALSGYENRDRIPSYDILVSIATTYNVSIDWLCGLSDKKALDNHISTYKDLFQLFVNILDTRYQNQDTMPIIDIINAETSIVTLTLHDDPNFQSFFSKWCDIFKLHCENTIDDDLYKMWIEKQLSTYDRPIDGNPF